MNLCRKLLKGGGIALLEQQSQSNQKTVNASSLGEIMWFEQATWKVWFALCCACVMWWFLMAWGLHSFRFDDAFITFRYGENLVLGRGVVFNLNERLMGSTAPGHLLLSALVYGIFGKLWMPSVMSLLGCMGWCLQSVAMYRIFGRLGKGWGIVLGAVVALGGAGSAAWVAMETHLVLASALWAIAFALEERWEGAAFFSALAALFRPDAALLGGLLGAWCLWLAPKRLWRCAAIFLVVWGPWLFFAWLYFGSPLPQSAATKFQRVSLGAYAYHELRHIAGLCLRGLGTSMTEIAVVWLFCVLGIAWLWKVSRPLLILPLYGGAHLAAYLYLRPYTSHAWHLYPAAVIFLVCAWCGFFAILVWLHKMQLVRGLVWMGMVSLMIGYGIQTWRYIGDYPTHYWLGARQAVYRDVSAYLKRVAKKTERVASVEVGTLAFHSDMRMHDWGGLISRGDVDKPKEPYQWAVVDRLYLKKLARGLFPLDVFRRSDFTAYLYDIRRPETFSLPLLSKKVRGPATSASTKNSQTFSAKESTCFSFRGAWGHLPRAGQGKGCVWTLAGTPTLAGERDHLRWFARFSTPMDIVRDGQSFLVAEMHQHRIRKVGPQGRVETWLGSGRGYQDGVGTQAKFFFPSAMVADGTGGWYIADTGNARIRRVFSDRRVVTVAGGKRGFRDGQAMTARFMQPQGLWRDRDGSLYIADTAAHRIRRWRTDGIVETWAGTGRPQVRDGSRQQASFLGPARILRDAKGSFFVTDMLGDALRRIDPDGRVHTPLRFARGSQPFGLALGQDGWLYLTLFGRHQVLRWREGMAKPQVVAGKQRWGRAFLDGSIHTALFAHPAGIVWDPTLRRLVLVEAENHCVRVLGVP